VGFLGGGAMGEALAAGVLAAGAKVRNVRAADPDPARRKQLEQALGIAASDDNAGVVEASDVVVLAVKPGLVAGVLAALGGPGDPALARPLWVSIAAGVPLAALAASLPPAARIVRAMPNTPALVHAGITGLHAAPAVGESDRQRADQLLAAVGATLWFEREADLDAVTAVSGSGPAYVFYAMEALETAARELGIAPEKARPLALWTFVGAAKLAIERGEEPAKLRANVTSKGGTTERALAMLEEAQVKAKFIEAVKAACERSRELGEEYGKG